MVWICATCGVETADSASPPGTCAICEDERQWVPAEGQQWITLDALRDRGTRIVIAEVEHDLWGLHAEPAVGIGQQMMLVRTPEGTLLFLENCSSVVEWSTRGEIAHVAIVISEGNAVYIYEATPAKVRRVTLDEYQTELARINRRGVEPRHPGRAQCDRDRDAR